MPNGRKLRIVRPEQAAPAGQAAPAAPAGQAAPAARGRGPERVQDRSRYRSVSPSGVRSDEGYRGWAAKCYAESCYKKPEEQQPLTYIGYSGGSGGLVQPRRRGNVSQQQWDIENAQRVRRNPRIDQLMNQVRAQKMARERKGELFPDRDPTNCAEASALSIALSYGENPSNLTFWPVNLNGQPIEFCKICGIWLDQTNHKIKPELL